jgi:hypothetical protein
MWSTAKNFRDLLRRHVSPSARDPPTQGPARGEQGQAAAETLFGNFGIGVFREMGVFGQNLKI